MMRLAVRDLRADRWRTAVGVAAVSLPLMVIAAAAVFLLNQRFSAAAMIPAEMGTGQALVQVGGRQVRAPQPSSTTRGSTPRSPEERGIRCPDSPILAG